MKIATKYIAFAIWATIANIASQDISIRLYDGPYAVTKSIMLGTVVGLLVKYILDKKYIFRIERVGFFDDTRLFALYTMTGIFTTLVFWGSEFGFDYLFQSKGMRYMGGVIGLAIGYYIKYNLDRRFVFSQKGGGMILTGWGKYPAIASEIIKPGGEEDVLNIARKTSPEIIARGLGRSYGDSALASHIVSTLSLDHFIGFEEEKGLLTCQAGVSLAEILRVFVPRGWFLPVTPGTKFVTVGGAIAGDVHGKNHHREGSFADHVVSLKIVTPSEGVVNCSREMNAGLFHASCAGMGLTGIIIEATFKLKPIQSAFIDETIIKVRNLEEMFDLFEEHKNKTYSVAWIDCLAKRQSLGRGLVMLGEHAMAGGFVPSKKTKISIPVDFPDLALNSLLVKGFNALYYHRRGKKQLERTIHYDSFFYPLDTIAHWNRIYGKKGFCQYQFVLPGKAGLGGMKVMLEHIVDSGRGSFLAVLKKFGKKNGNYLSFPLEGHTLALDFKREEGLFELFDELDKRVLDYGGRLYMAKDAHMSGNMMKKSYPDWKKFMAVRKQYGADKMFHSLQSRRLGL